MTVVTETYKWKDLVDPYTPEHEQPHGYDFSVESIQRMVGSGALWTDNKRLPKYEPVSWFKDTVHLATGAYIVQFREVVSMPLDAMGYMRPRSSLLRMGASLETAVWDAGYQGKSSTLLVVYNPSGIVIERGAPIGQMILHLTESQTRGYDGQYQHEGIDDGISARLFIGAPGDSPAAVREALAYQTETATTVG